jgi:hypothetical protein
MPTKSVYLYKSKVNKFGFLELMVYEVTKLTNGKISVCGFYWNKELKQAGRAKRQFKPSDLKGYLIHYKTIYKKVK